MFASEKEWPSDALTGSRLSEDCVKGNSPGDDCAAPTLQQVYLDIYIYINKIFIVIAQAIAVKVTGFLYKGNSELIQFEAEELSHLRTVSLCRMSVPPGKWPVALANGPHGSPTFEGFCQRRL